MMQSVCRLAGLSPRLGFYFTAAPIGTTLLPLLGFPQNSAHTSISRRRFSNRSPLERSGFAPALERDESHVG
jgi:hypothetical protein